MIGNFIGWCVFGLIAGAIARLLTPGRDRLGCLGTIVVGVAGSFAGGFLGHLIFGESGERVYPAGLIGSVIGAILVLVLMRRLAPRR